MRQFVDTFRQPKAVILLSGMQMCNCFSYYGISALLVLFMVHALGLPDLVAFGIYAIFYGLVELGSVFGSSLAERLLGIRRTIALGGWISTAGALFLAYGWFFLGLSALVIGMGLFSTNITVLMGHYYKGKEEERLNGFTLFYVAMYVGIFLGTVGCGFLAETYGWSYGFFLGGCAMACGNFLLLRFHSVLEGKGEQLVPLAKGKAIKALFILLCAGSCVLYAFLKQAWVLPFLPFVALVILLGIFRGLYQKKILTRKQLIQLAIHFVALVLFFSGEEQIGSSLLIFTDRMTGHLCFGIPIATSAILAFNPIVIIIFGAFNGTIKKKLSHPGFHFFAPFLLSSAAFATVLCARSFLSHPSILVLMAVVGVISLAEAIMGPSVYTMCSEVAHKADDPRVLRILPMGFCLSATLGGSMSQYIAKTGYSQGFLYLSLLLLIGGALLSVGHVVFGDLKRKKEGKR